MRQMGRVTMAFCFVDLTGFTRFTEEEGDEEAIDLVERFVETVEATLPAEALIVKTIGDEVMIVSPDPVTLTEWAVGLPRPSSATAPSRGSGSTTAAPSTATATTSAPRSISPTGSSPGRSGAR